MDEVFQPGSQPTAPCDLHVSAYVDERDQTLTAAHCPGARQQVFERYPPTFHSWASSAGRPLLPSKLSPRCPQAQEVYAQLLSAQPSLSVAPRIVFPRAGARFLLDPAVSEEQQRIRIEASSHAERVRFLLDGRLLADRRAPFQVSWALSKGEHLLSAETAEGERSNPVRFVVE
jgi:membrane carboxypeptidase/penicillin-binding protein PbpC